MVRKLFAGAVLCLWIVLLAPTLSALSADLKAGMEAYQAKDYALALQIWRPLAEGGDTAAQVLVGHMYFGGLGVVQDSKEAERWYRLAADKGNPDGEVNLGSLYYNGVSVAENRPEAARLYRLAAEKGDAAGQYNLGIMYRGGLGIEQDLVQAYYWSALAEGQGRPGAKVEKELAAKEMTPEQIAEAEKKVSNFRPRALSAALGE
jgi:TPR repeat protein